MRLFDASTTEIGTRRIAFELVVKGFAVIDFPDPEFDSMAENVKNALRHRYDFDNWREHGHKNGMGLRVQDAGALVKTSSASPAMHTSLPCSRLYGCQA